jgi:RNA-directed DNA polymerase
MRRRPAAQLWFAFDEEGKVPIRRPGDERPVAGAQLMERIVEWSNMEAAVRRVESNDGSPGIDGMKAKELRSYLREHWEEIREALLAGLYQPHPVLRTEIPKTGGGMRGLGIPVVVDRFIQQMVLQVLQQEWDGTFSDHSYGFRPGRSAIQAVEAAQAYLKGGNSWVVDLDLERFFDRVNWDKLLSAVRKRVRDERVVELIARFLRAGVLEDGALHEQTSGTPQGGPLSPLLANLLLDELDRELTRRGHRFVRYADDCNIYVCSERAGKRVMASITQFLSRRLKLQVNESKSAVGRPWKRKFLGYNLTRKHRRAVSPQAVERMKDRTRTLTRRTRGRSLRQVVGELGRYLRGWKAFFGHAEVRTVFRELDKWIRRKLRCYVLKQWGRGRYKALRSRGVSRDLAWNTTKSAHGPWRLSRSPALNIALPWGYFARLGLPQLCDG